MGEVKNCSSAGLDKLSNVIDIADFMKKLCHWQHERSSLASDSQALITLDNIIKQILTSDKANQMRKNYISERNKSVFDVRCKEALCVIENELSELLINQHVRILSTSSYSAGTHIYDPSKLNENQISELDFSVILDEKKALNRDDVFRCLTQNDYKPCGQLDVHEYIFCKPVFGVNVNVRIMYLSKSVNKIILHDFLNWNLKQEDAEVISLIKFLASDNIQLYNNLISMIHGALLCKAEKDNNFNNSQTKALEAALYM